METDLKGRVAVVTGGSRGIGAESARRLAAAGAAVVVSGRDREEIEKVTGSIERAGGRAIAVTADVTRSEDLERLRSETEAALGAPDILLAFAGSGSELRPLIDTTEAEWRRVVETNLTATFLTLRTFVPGMMERGRG